MILTWGKSRKALINMKFLKILWQSHSKQNFEFRKLSLVKPCVVGKADPPNLFLKVFSFSNVKEGNFSVFKNML